MASGSFGAGQLLDMVTYRFFLQARIRRPF
jgi:hypothetical protein